MGTKKTERKNENTMARKVAFVVAVLVVLGIAAVASASQVPDWDQKAGQDPRKAKKRLPNHLGFPPRTLKGRRERPSGEPASDPTADELVLFVLLKADRSMTPQEGEVVAAAAADQYKALLVRSGFTVHICQVVSFHKLLIEVEGKEHKEAVTALLMAEEFVEWVEERPHYTPF